MANFIKEGAASAGAEVLQKSVAEASVADSVCDVLCLGCPSMGDEVLEEAEFEPFLARIEGSLGGRKLALFGSYGWGDGQWMRDWSERMEKSGAVLVAEGLMVNDGPEGNECRAFGTAIAQG